MQFQYANYSSPHYVSTGKGSLTFRLINQRYDFAFGFFSGDLTNVCHFLAIFLPPPKSTQNSLINPFCKITKMHNSSNIIAADGLSVMNFFGETGWGVSSLFLKLSPTKSASKIQMHLCGQDWHLERNGIQ